MTWNVEWTVVNGHSGARPDRSPTRIYQGDVVRFVLQLSNDYLYALETAETDRGWQRRPKILVRDSQGSETTTHANENNPLVIEYTFNSEGSNHLRLRGMAQRFVNPIQRTYRRDARGELPREAMFPDLDLMRELHVMPSTSRGEAAASTTGNQSDSAQIQQSRMDRRREQANRLRRQQNQQREEAIETLDEDAQQRRDAAIPGRGRLSQRGVLLGINMLEAHQMSTRRIEDVQVYLARLQSSVNVTPALRLYNGSWEDVPNHGYVQRTRVLQQRTAWRVRDDYRIQKVRQYRYKFGAATSRGLDQRPPIRTNEPIETIRLSANDWLVVKFSRNGAKSLIPAQAAIESIRTENLLELASAMVTLASLALAAATSPHAFAFELLANTMLPEEVNMAIGVAAISVGVVRGLARMLARVIRNTSTLRAANTALLRRMARAMRRQGSPATVRGPPPNPRGTNPGISNQQRGLSPRTGDTLPGIGPSPLSPRTGNTLPGIGPGPDDIGHARTMPGSRSGQTQPGVGPGPDDIGHARTLPQTRRPNDTLPGIGPDSNDPVLARTLPGSRTGQTVPGVGPGPNSPGYARTLPRMRSTTPAPSGPPGSPLPSPDGRIMQMGNNNTTLRELTAEDVERIRHWRRTYAPQERIGTRGEGPRFSGPTEGIMYQQAWIEAGGSGEAPQFGFMVYTEGRPIVVMNNSLMPSGTPGLHIPFTEPATW